MQQEIVTKSGAFSRSETLGCSTRRQILHVLLVLAMLGTAVFLRVYRLDKESLWFDEHINWRFVNAPTTAEYMRQTCSIDATLAPLYYITLYQWAHANGQQVYRARLLSVAFGMITALILYFFSRFLFGPTAGFVTLSMFSLSNICIYYSQEIRVYALLLLFAALSAYSLFRALQSRGTFWWLLHATANFALAWTHFFGVFLLLTEGLYLLLFHYRPWPRFLGWCAVHALLAGTLLLWIVNIDFELLKATTAFIQTHALRDIVHCYAWPAIFLPVSCYSQVWISWAVCAILVAFGWYAFSRRKTVPNGNQTWMGVAFLLLWLTVPVSLMFAITYLGKPCVLLRYVLHASLPFCVLIGGAVAAVKWSPLRWSIIVALLALLVWQSFEQDRPYRIGIREGACIMAQRITPDDILLVQAFGIPMELVREYFPLSESRMQIGNTCEDMVRLASETLAQHSATWALFAADYVSGPNPFLDFEQKIEAQGLTLEPFPLPSGQPAFMATRVWPNQNSMCGINVASLYRISRTGAKPDGSAEPTSKRP